MEGVPLKYHSYICDRSNKNITWVHTDLQENSVNKRVFDVAQQSIAYRMMDKIIFVSETLRQKFSKIFINQLPTDVIYNVVKTSLIL